MKKCLKGCILSLLILAVVVCSAPDVVKAVGEIQTYCERCNKVTTWDFYASNTNEYVSAYCSNCARTVVANQVYFFNEWDCKSCGNVRIIKTVMRKTCTICYKDLM